jgi:hypothetical protein
LAVDEDDILVQTFFIRKIPDFLDRPENGRFLYILHYVRQASTDEF